MIRKFKVELDIELEDKEFMKDDLSFNDYITQELGWSQESFESFKISKIKEIPVSKSSAKK
jgi:hypothetical protein